MNEVVILSAARTPIGAFLGALKDVPAPKLGAAAIKEAVKRARVPADRIDEGLMGCVLPAGLGQAPARQAIIFAGLPNTVRATTINRVCGSGLKTVMLAHQMIRVGDASLVVAGGMENMSQAPYLVDKAREGLRMGNGKIVDSMIHDGLWDAYHNNHMGDSAELCAREYKVSRQDQDRYATASYRRALESISSGKFQEEIAPVEVPDRKATKLVNTDEEPARANLERFGDLRPAFQKEGTITAANASSLSDGAAALVLASADLARELGVKPMARIIAQESHAQAPEWFTTAPVGAIKKLLAKAKMKPNEVDLYEINEAFSVVALACLKDLGLSEDKVNVRGGAVALGHPIGASGARILVTLLHTLKAEKKRFGVAGICIGGGEASALLVENLD